MSEKLQLRIAEEQSGGVKKNVCLRVPGELHAAMKEVRQKYDVNWSRAAAKAFQEVVDQANRQDQESGSDSS